MPEWVMTLLIGGGVLAGVMTGTGKLFNAWHEDRREKAAAEAAEKKALQEGAEKLRAKIESLLMDAVAREQEDHRERGERLAMDARLIELIAAMTSALKESSVLLAQLKKDAP